jgi:hypothetical protein
VGLFSRKKRTLEGIGSTRIELWFPHDQARSVETLAAVRTTHTGDGPLLGHMASALLDFVLALMRAALEERPQPDLDPASVANLSEQVGTVTRAVVEAGIDRATAGMLLVRPMRVGGDVPERASDVELTLTVQARPDLEKLVARVDAPGGPTALMAGGLRTGLDLLVAAFWGLLADAAEQVPREALFFLAAEIDFQLAAVAEDPSILELSEFGGRSAWIGYVNARALVDEHARSLEE